MIDAENVAKPCSKMYCVEYGTEPDSSGAVYCKYHAVSKTPPTYWTPDYSYVGPVCLSSR
jgi:hypothetical protein